MNYNELRTAVKNEEIEAVICDDKKYRLFVSGDTIGYFNSGSSRHGKIFYSTMLENISKVILKKKVDSDIITFNLISKFKKMASTATFTNGFIRDCHNLPNTYEDWVNDGKKSLYEYNITTGTRIDGNVISLKRISKKYGYYIEQLKELMKTRPVGEHVVCSRVPFSGYEMTISTRKYENNDFFVHMAMEYKNCGNGYYYYLINDENFIGCDVD